MLKPRVQVHSESGVLVAEFWDCLRLDPAPVQELRKEFEAHLRAQGRPEVVIDLNGVGHAGSAALGGFLSLHRLALQRGGQMVFCNVDPNVFEVFRVSKLVTLFAFETDVAKALARVNGPAAGSSESPATGQPADPPTDGKPAKSGSDAPLRRGRRQSS